MWVHWQTEAVKAQGEVAEFKRYDWDLVLTTANKNFDTIKAEADTLRSEVELITKERDEARRLIAMKQVAHDSLAKLHCTLQNQHSKMRVERDSLRAEVERLKAHNLAKTIASKPLSPDEVRDGEAPSSKKGGGEPCRKATSDPVCIAPPTSKPEAGATPETDALWMRLMDACKTSGVHPKEAGDAFGMLAQFRTLELQRDEARQQLAALQEAFDSNCSSTAHAVAQLEKERDSLRSKAAEDAALIASHVRTINQWERINAEQVDKIEAMEKEIAWLRAKLNMLLEENGQLSVLLSDEESSEDVATATARATRAEADAAAMRLEMEGIANMPEYDQDDARRLRYRAKNALSTTPAEHLAKLQAAEADVKRTDWWEEAMRNQDHRLPDWEDDRKYWFINVLQGPECGDAFAGVARRSFKTFREAIDAAMKEAK